LLHYLLSNFRLLTSLFIFFVIWQELSECVDYGVWISEVPKYLAPIKERQDRLKWTEVVFGKHPDPEKRGTEIKDAQLSIVLKDLLDKQEERYLRWQEIEGPITDDMVEIKDPFKGYALTRALEQGRLKFTREEFEENFHFEPKLEATKFSYDCYMKVGEKSFRPQKLLRVDFSTAQLKNKVISQEANAILANKPNQFDYIKVGKTFFTPILQDAGHGLTWKYQNYETGKYLVSNGQVVELKVNKPITGISPYYRFFVWFVVASKFAIAVALGIYGAGWILFGDQDAGNMILNTLASVFIFTVDDIVYVATTSKLGKAMTEHESNAISFCAREPSHDYSARRNLYFSCCVQLCLVATTIAVNFGWECEAGTLAPKQ
jgi:hypothetical protein